MRHLLEASVAVSLLLCVYGCGNGSGGSSSSGSSGSSSSGGSSGGQSSSGASSSSSGGTGSSGGSSGSGSSSGGQSSSGGDGGIASQTCTNPAYTIALDPSNPQNGMTLNGFYVDTDTWNAAKYPLTQTMYVCAYNNWYVIANMNNNSGDGAVKTYPNVHKDFTSTNPLISSFNTISSSFAHTAPHVGIYEFAYDIWLNGVAGSGSTEVMIWTDNYYQVPPPPVVETVTFDGQNYDVYTANNHSYIAFVEKTNVTSGTVNLLSFFNNIISKGWIPASSTVGAIDYGVELVSTNSMNATFAVNNFSLTTN